MPYLSQRDRDDIIFGVQQGFDFIAASFVRTAQDVYDIRNLLNEYDSKIRIIAKIENREGVNNIDSILSAADAVMVARGDLGVEIDFTELPGIQKSVIDRSFSFGKPIVTATQMLDSMMVNPRPTRAEISDVANAIYDGTSAIMLSGETAAGAYPVEALKTMSAIAERTENEVHYRDNRLTDTTGQISVSDATAHAACLTAKDVNASAIVTVSESGNTARLLSKYRPSQPIIACVMDEQVQRQLSVSWGITPLMMDLAASTDELIEKSTALAKEHGYLHDGELAVVTAGVPVGVSGTTNMIKIHMIGNCLATGVGVGPEGAALANATGKACVCRTIEEIRAKFKPGMVLVVPSTSNEMLSYVRDAAALVVEEAGLNSHAAIAGKALLKPTIVAPSALPPHPRRSDGRCGLRTRQRPALQADLGRHSMERIASFCVDHTRLDCGIYLSRQDGDVLTWDIRMKKPNQGDYLSTGAATRWSTSSPPTPATASIRTASSTSAPWAAAPAFIC